jgi:hypothetical protein
MSITRADLSLIVGSALSSVSFSSGIERREIVEIDAVADGVGIVEIDLGDAYEAEIALALLGAANLAFDRVAVLRPNLRT